MTAHGLVYHMQQYMQHDQQEVSSTRAAFLDIPCPSQGPVHIYSAIYEDNSVVANTMFSSDHVASQDKDL